MEHRLIYADVADHLLIQGYEIDDVPTANGVKEEKHGRWVSPTSASNYYADEAVMCENCGKDYAIEDLCRVGDIHGRVNYCPMCGSKMDLGGGKL